MASLILWNEFEQAPEVGDGQESLTFCSPWGHRELDTTEHAHIVHSTVQPELRTPELKEHVSSQV